MALAFGVLFLAPGSLQGLVPSAVRMAAVIWRPLDEEAVPAARLPGSPATTAPGPGVGRRAI